MPRIRVGRGSFAGLERWAKRRKPSDAGETITGCTSERTAERRPVGARPPCARVGDLVSRAAGDLATDRWRTPRYATGRYPVPQRRSGQHRHSIAPNEIQVPEGQAIIDVELKAFTEIRPDLSLELRIESMKLTCDLLVVLDLADRASYNRAMTPQWYLLAA